MSIWMELRCDRNKQNGSCHSDKNMGPKGFSKTRLLAEGKAFGWKFEKGDKAICPGCK